MTPDQQMFIYRWYPIMGCSYCAKQLGIPFHDVAEYARERGIPGLQQDYEYTIAEIAAHLGMTEIETKTILYAGIRKIKRAFKEKLNGKSDIRDDRQTEG